jgi:hypothetical protein
MVLMIGPLAVAGCGSSATQDPSQAVVDSASGFLDACGNREFDNIRSSFTQGYIETNQVPDPIGEKDLLAAMGDLSSYRLDPNDVSLQGDMAIVTVTVEIVGKGKKSETIILRPEAGAWKVDSFTAMDWTSKPASTASGDVEVEQALRDFVIACIDGKTDYIFDNLSAEYKKNYHLGQPWTSAQFSGIFGTARSYNFNPADIVVEAGVASVDVTIEFGTRGNLQSETSRVELVKEGKWVINDFPFFIY